jgi:hypothetical protein
MAEHDETVWRVGRQLDAHRAVGAAVTGTGRDHLATGDLAAETAGEFGKVKSSHCKLS